jgi:hypothetical protein
MKPAAVKKITFTSVTNDCVRGHLLTICPVEKRESSKDFEINLDAHDQTLVRLVTVDGRRFYPASTKVGEVISPSHAL